MMKRTISGMTGSGSLAHNRRDFIAENVNPNRVYLNICYRDENLKDVYKELFDESVERYNVGKRNDRKITNYYDKIQHGKQEKLFHEVIFQIGNNKDMAAETPEGDLAVKVLDEYMQDFQRRNPTLRVFCCYLHQDEATPHLHIDFLDLMVSPEGIKYNAKSNNQSRCFFLMFNDWWNEIIFDDKKNKFTRRDIVTYVANQDGGAHVDPELDESYATLTKMNSLGWTDYNGNKPLNNPAYQAIRTIANEVLYSIAISASGLKNRKKQKGKEFEMRIVDNFGRRYKWSKTEITCSLETMELVFQDKVEKRTLYIDEYKNGSKVEYVGP